MRTHHESTRLCALFLLACTGLTTTGEPENEHPVRDTDEGTSGPGEDESPSEGNAGGGGSGSSGGSGGGSGASGGASTAADDAEILSWDLPTILSCSEATVAELVVRNTGTDSWDRNQGYKLGAVDDSDPFHAPDPRVWLPEDSEVLPGESWVFEIDLVAPTEPGLYTTDWQMVHEDVTWFGDSLSVDIAVECEEETGGEWETEACARNGSEICDDEVFYVEEGLRVALLCSEATGGISFISSNTGPEQSDGMSRCQGWEDNGQNAWDHLDYVESFVCSTPGEIVEVDLSAWAGGDLWFGSHDHPGGGGEMTSTCLLTQPE